MDDLLDADDGGAPLRAAVARAERWITSIYRLDLDLGAARFLMPPERARELLPEGAPRSGVLVVEEPDAVSLGLYVDPRANPRVDGNLEDLEAREISGKVSGETLDMTAVIYSETNELHVGLRMRRHRSRYPPVVQVKGGGKTRTVRWEEGQHGGWHKTQHFLWEGVLPLWEGCEKEGIDLAISNLGELLELHLDWPGKD